MAKKNLPIKLFQKRRIDERQTEGSGNNEAPRWQLTGEDLDIRIATLLEPFEIVTNEFTNRKSERDFIPVTLKVDIDDDAIAKTHRKDIQKLFNGRRTKNNIIGFIDTNTAIVKVDSLEHSLEIQRNIRSSVKYAKSISAVESIEVFEPIVNYDDEEVLKITLIDFLNFELNNAVRNSFKVYCKSLDINYKETVYSTSLIVYKIERPNQTVLDKLEEFEAIETITFMPKYSVGIDSLSTENGFTPSQPKENVEYPVIGVLDSGISKNSYLEPWLVDEKFSSYPEELIDNSHGTCVSSVILYGDKLQGENLSGISGAKIFDATVFPDNKQETVYEDELVENIREAISKNKKIKIWNLSLGTSKESNTNDFSDFGIALDNIQEANDVIICKSAGNCKNFISGRPKSRIAQSADSMRALVIGSVAHSKKDDDIADPLHPSPFTRIGPGPANSIKPDLVTVGGNAGVKNGNVIQNGIKAIAPDGQIVEIVGTSFATPRVTALLSELNFKIKEDFNPTLLKALAIHSAKYPNKLSLPINERVNQMGFGIPSPADEIVYNDPHEITLILQENLSKGEFIEILDFPFPESLVDNEGHFYGEIKVTMVAQPVLREKQGAEYCQSNLKLIFGTYERIKDRDISKSNILNEFGPDITRNVLNESNYKAQFKKDTDSDYARERVLLNYGKKYQPVKKYSVNLNEMTPSNKKYLEAHRKWYVKIEGSYRDFAETLAKEDGELLNQDFTLIVTIRDNKREHNVYNEVSQLLETRNFLHNNIKLREEIRIRIEGESNE